MRFAALLAVLAIPLYAAADDAPKPADVKLESIFNGKDFAGWKVPKDNIWWRVEDGAIVCENGPRKKGSILWTDKSYTDFVLECEFRFTGKVDSGIFLRTEKQQIQIGISGSLKRDMTGSIYVPGKGYPKDAKGIEQLKPEGEWNHIRAEVRGPRYEIWLNGTHILSFDGGDKATETGPIGLQLHGNRVMRTDFRKLHVGEL